MEIDGKMERTSKLRKLTVGRKRRLKGGTKQ